MNPGWLVLQQHVALGSCLSAVHVVRSRCFASQRPSGDQPVGLSSSKSNKE